MVAGEPGEKLSHSTVNRHLILSKELTYRFPTSPPIRGACPPGIAFSRFHYVKSPTSSQGAGFQWLRSTVRETRLGGPGELPLGSGWRKDGQEWGASAFHCSEMPTLWCSCLGPSMFCCLWEYSVNLSALFTKRSDQYRSQLDHQHLSSVSEPRRPPLRTPLPLEEGGEADPGT